MPSRTDAGVGMDQVSLDRLRTAWLSTEAAVVAAVVFFLLQRPFEWVLEGHGHSILDFELAGSTATQIVRDWGNAGVAAAQSQLVVDFFFIVSYALAIWYASRVVVLTLGAAAPAVRWLFQVVGVAGIFAGLCDAGENAILLMVLNGHAEDWADVARTAARVKFATVFGAGGLALPGVVLAGLLARIGRRSWLAANADGFRWLRGADHDTVAEPGRPPLTHPDPTPELTGTAISCSGGGIRSASFCLGGLQALTKAGIYQQARFITAVSGGAYMAASYSMIRGYSNATNGKTLLTTDLPAYAPGSPEEIRLRNNTRYLLADGRVAVIGVFNVMYGLLLNLGALLVAVFVAARVTGWVMHEWGVLRDFSTPHASVGFPGWLKWTVAGVFLASLGLYVLLDRVRDVYFRPRPGGLVAVRAWTVRLLVAGLAATIFLIGAPLAVTGLYNLATHNSPNEAVARLITATGFATVKGCDTAATAAAKASRDQAAKAATKAEADAVANETANGATKAAAARAGVVAAEAARKAAVKAFPDRGACGSHTRRATADALAPGEVEQASRGAQATGIAGLLAALIGVIRLVVGRLKPKETDPTPGSKKSIVTGLVDRVRKALMPWLGSAIAAVLIGVLYLRWLQDAALEGATPRQVTTVSLALVGFAALKLVTDVNRNSIHPYYRERLAAAFAMRRTEDGSAAPLPYAQPARFSKLREPRGEDQPASGPQLIVCAAANVDDQGLVPPGRKAVSFTFAADFVGVSTGFPGRLGQALARQATTREYENYAGPRLLTLPAAVAVSGAAVSPVMGRQTRPSVRFLLGLSNVRLGLWLPNPDRVQRAHPVPEPRQKFLFQKPWWKFWQKLVWQWRRPGPGSLVLELLGRNSIRRRWLYVTDGGHYENLGLVEALRRRPKTVFAFDGSGDKPNNWGTLGEAVSVARADLGVEIDIDPAVMNSDDKRLVDVAVARGTYTYADGATGTLWLAKLGTPRTAPWDVRSYANRDSAFPAKSTAQQLYGDLEFESYRKIGELAGQHAADASAAEGRTGCRPWRRKPKN